MFDTLKKIEISRAASLSIILIEKKNDGKDFDIFHSLAASTFRKSEKL